MSGTIRTVICVLLLAGLAYGHHSFTAEFDQKKPVKLTSTGDGLHCHECRRVYPIENDIPVMLVDASRPEDDSPESP